MSDNAGEDKTNQHIFGDLGRGCGDITNSCPFWGIGVFGILSPIRNALSVFFIPAGRDWTTLGLALVGGKTVSPTRRPQPPPPPPARLPPARLHVLGIGGLWVWTIPIQIQ